MSQLSDDENSDSNDSNDFLIPDKKINLNLSFSEQLVNELNVRDTPIAQEIFDDSKSNYLNDNNINSNKIFFQVLKNLETANHQNFEDEINKLVPSTSKIINLTNHKSDDLSEEISNLLQQGESSATLSKQYNIQEKDENYKLETETNYIRPQKEIQIYLPEENLMFHNKKKKQQDLQKLLKNKFNQRIRISQINIHKVGLLCWLSHGFFLNGLANDPELLRIALSLVFSNNYPKTQIDLEYIRKFTNWFIKMFEICENYKQVTFTKDILIKRIKEKKIYNYKEIILLYVAIMRGMGINCRLVISLQPPSLKPKSEQLFKVTNSQEKNKNFKLINKQETDQRINTVESTNLQQFQENLICLKKAIPENSCEAIRIRSLENKKQAATILKSKIVKNSLKENKIELNKNSKITKSNNSNKKEYDDITNECNLPIAKKLYLKTNKTIKQEEDKVNILSINKKQKKSTSNILKRKCKSSKYLFTGATSDLSNDDDCIEKKAKKSVLNNKLKNDTMMSKAIDNKNRYRKLLSSNEDENIIKNNYDMWVEVYIECESSWISVDILDKKINCVSEIYKKAGTPVLYVVAWNSAGTLKDVTRRYCPRWLTDTRKKRIDDKWWRETLSNWKETKTTISKTEDEQLLQRELEQPLPKSFAECKGHPLYVLTRHLLKFEALYPPDVVPLGHLKTGEAIYSRHCVHTLYSRETWIKRARVVKPAQEAYKVVKSMPKFDKFSGVKIKDQPLELFGKWQTTPYVPPEAKDGKVPRNEYGNVDLFKKCMLPKGTVYINLPGLNRIARKLNIDCAPACVGFNFGCRGAIPAFEGFIVCEEYEDILRTAWEEQQIEAQARAKIKREKKIFGNWKKLIKGLLIQERLVLKYNFREKED